MTFSGHRPMWSWPYLAFGDNDGCTIVEMPSGRVCAQVASWHRGWLSPTTLLVTNDCPGGQRLSVLSVTGELTPLDVQPDHAVGAVGASGYWASNVGGIVRVNDVVIANDPLRNLGIEANGNWLLYGVNENAPGHDDWRAWTQRVYNVATQVTRRIQHLIPARGYTLSPAGHYAYGDAVHARLNTLDGADVDVTSTTPPADFAPVVVAGPGGWWLWGVVGAEARHAVVRRLGATEGYLLDLEQGASSLAVIWAGGAWLVAVADAVGRLGAWAATIGAMQPLPLTVPSAITLPPLGRSIDVGYFYRDTSAIQYGGDNPDAPCTVSVIIDPLALPAEPFEGVHPKMIVDGGCLFEMARHPEWWDRWVGTYLAAEGDEVLLEKMATAVRTLSANLGLPQKPLITYTANVLFPDALAATDVIGVQAYAEVGWTPAQLQARVSGDLNRMRHRRVALICQAYDRANPWWTGERLAALQPVYWELARQFSNVEYLLLFSDGRRGGTRDHQEMRPWHNAMVQQA